MPRKPRKPRVTRQPIPPGLRAYFEMGSSDGDDEAGRCDVFLLLCNDEKLKAAWEACRDEILPDFIREHPGRRPYIWWRYEAPKPRQRVGGTGTPSHEVLAYSPDLAFGIPTCWPSKFEEAYYNGRAKDIQGKIIPTNYKPGDFAGVAIDPEDPPTFESEAIFLRRHRFLKPAERTFLASHPELLEPEAITFDEDESGTTHDPS